MEEISFELDLEYSEGIRYWLSDLYEELTGFRSGRQIIRPAALRPIAEEAGLYVWKARWVHCYCNIRPKYRGFVQPGKGFTLPKSAYREAYDFGGGTAAYILHSLVGWQKESNSTDYYAAILLAKQFMMLGQTPKYAQRVGSSDLECPTEIINRELIKRRLVGRFRIATQKPVVCLENRRMMFADEEENDEN